MSVKKSSANSGIERFNSGITQRPDGGISMVNVPVGVMIGRAYGVRPIDVRGLPGWALSIDDRYDLIATASLPDATAAERAAMLQAALADRFKLAVHFEKREQATYDLVVARRDGRLGPGLTRVDTDCDAAERAAAVAAAGPTPPPRVSCPISRRRRRRARSASSRPRCGIGSAMGRALLAISWKARAPWPR